MIRGFLLFFAALVFASATGLAFGIYVGPAVDAKHFRATVDAGVRAVSESAASVVEKFKVTPGKAPVTPVNLPQATAPAEVAAPSKEAGPDTSVQPQSDPGYGDLSVNGVTPPDRRPQDVVEPSSPVTQSPGSQPSGPATQSPGSQPSGPVTQSPVGQPTPAIATEEPVGSISPAPSSDRETGKQARPPSKKPVARVNPNPKPRPAHKPVAKLKPRLRPEYRPVARLKPMPRSNPEPERVDKFVEQPMVDPPHPDGADGWLPWLR